MCSMKRSTPRDLVLELLGGAEDVGVVLGEVAHPEEAVQHAAHLVAVHLAELGPAQRQLAVAAPPALVNEQAAGAVHGLDGVRRPVDLGEVHVLAVVVPVARALPELAAQDRRSAQLLVAGLRRARRASSRSWRSSRRRPLGWKNGKPGPSSWKLNRSRSRPMRAVVALAGHLEGLEVGGELASFGEGGAVDAGEHGRCARRRASRRRPGSASLKVPLPMRPVLGRCGPRQRSTNSPWV